MWLISSAVARLRTVCHAIILAPLCFYTVTVAQDKIDIKTMSGMTMAELMGVTIVTASKVAELLSDAPATVIVITRREIEQRGYTDLSQILDDLPGMDVIRVNNDISFKNYMRGYRNSFGTPYLLMLDGLPWTDLYYNDSETMRACPMSNIDRVEIVYGPVSAVYGANAFTGVINVLSVKDKDRNGSYFSGATGFGTRGKIYGDINYFYKRDDIKISLTSRFENGEDFPETNEEYEWTKGKYITDRRLWGGFTDSPASAGLTSPHRHRALDLRAYLGDIEFGAQYYQLYSGYSVEYAADKVLPNVVWNKIDYSMYGQFRRDLTSRTSSTTVLRYFGSDIPNSSALAQGFNVIDESGDTMRVINYELWQTLNSSWSLQEDLHYQATDRLSLMTGFRYEQKNLQKAYEISSGPFLPPDSVYADTYEFPEPPAPTYRYQNRIVTEDKGAYFNVRYVHNDNLVLHSGIRHDYNSQYGGSTTLRIGMNRRFGRLMAKLLYGEGFQAPAPRVLYGAWTGLGSDPDLKPEESRTFELSASFTTLRTLHTLSLYHVVNSNTILNYQIGGRNVGERIIYGMDYHLKHTLHISGLDEFMFWAYYSYIHTEGDEVYDAGTDSFTRGEIGDISPHKILFGITGSWEEYLTTTVLGRFIHTRKTVATNPVPEVEGYVLIDAVVRVKQLAGDGLGLVLRVKNLFDKHYFHPGIRTADAGIDPGFFSGNGVWHGSKGWLNSLLPQPGREIVLSLEYHL